MDGLQDYEYELPADLIAQEPSPERDRSRLLVVHRGSRAWDHRRFHELPEYMRPGDLMVLNETRVFPARLRVRRPTGGRVEVFLLERHASGKAWKALGRPARALRPGTECRLDGDSVTVHPIAREADKIIVEFRRGDRVLAAGGTRR